MLVAAEVLGYISLVAFVAFYIILPIHIKTENKYLDYILVTLAALFSLCGIFAFFFGLMNLIK